LMSVPDIVVVAVPAFALGFACALLGGLIGPLITRGR